MVCAIAFLVYRYALGLIAPFIIAFLLCSLVHPLVRRIKKAMKTEHNVVSFIVMLLVYALVGTGLFWLIMGISFWLRDRFGQLTGFYEDTLAPSMEQAWEALSVFLGNLPGDLQIQMGTVHEAIMQGVQTLITALSQRGLNMVTSFTGGLASFLVSFVFTILLSFFISIYYDSVVLFLKKQLPEKVRDNIEETREIMRGTVGRYIVAYLKVMAITFAELCAGLLLLGVPNAVFIAAGVAILDAMPIVGTGTVLIPWAIFELVRGNFTLALGLIILYAVITFVRYIVEPKIVGDNIGLNPVVSIMSIYLGLRLFGVVGMILMPICVKIVLELHSRGKIRVFRE
jgi:sporulation integral membrane protein YtvI